ncbi:F-box domain-containing protein [Mycena sanguinolenta]|uniref:F-box domain-containing protein n=1 Tax=Mycena sanguinolenta TaxID=230812 RepID=A0A8H6Z2K0_9AGAR|nr:F-box domain-containing protein [Mycena sanguinolenta]
MNHQKTPTRSLSSPSYRNAMYAHLAYLEDKISNSTDRREEFEEERLSLLACRVQNRAILSPVRRIPTEILGDIFWWTLPSIRDLERSGFDFRNSPWLLTHISSRWRAISIATSSLWLCIVIDYSEIRHKGPRGPSSEHHLSLVEAQIQRSRAQQLQVHFYACLEMNSRAQIQMFELLSQHSSRWEGLSLGLSSKIFPSLATLRGRLPSLKRLWVQWDDSETDSVESLLDCFQTASSLVDVGVFNEYRHVPMCLPAPQLTRYGLTGSWSIHECILQGAPNLVEAHIGCVFDLELWSGSLIELQRLQRLYISDWLILSVLKAPALQELAVSLYPDEGPRYLNCLRDFVNRSLCSLRRICHRKSPEAHTIIEILKSFPSLTELVLITHYPVSEVISALRLTGSTVVAPQLQTLFFGCEVDATIDYTAYLDMLKACWEAKDCALQHAALITCGKPPLEPLTFIGLLALRQAGLDLVLSENESESFGFIKAWLYGTTWN